jgi:hypothetical protein
MAREKKRTKISASKQEKIRRELKDLFDGLSKKLSRLATSQGSFGGVSFEDAVQQVCLTLWEEGADDLPEDETGREGFILARAAALLAKNKRRERGRQQALDRAAPNAPTECEMQRILINDENRRIIALAWAALEGKPLDRAVLYFLASGVDKKDTQRLAKLLKCRVQKATKIKTRVIELLQTIAMELQDVDSNGDSK